MPCTGGTGMLGEAGSLNEILAAHLSLDYQASADNALKLLFRVYKVSNALCAAHKSAGTDWRYKGFAGISFWPAVVALNGELNTGRYHNTDPQLYDAYIPFAKKHSKPDASRFPLERYEEASLWLVHPRSPTAIPMLACLREYYASGQRTAPTNTNALVLHLLSTDRCIKLLRRQYKPEDTASALAWLEALKTRVTPDDRTDVHELLRKHQLVDESIRWVRGSDDGH
jgi:hypothetical protein